MSKDPFNHCSGECEAERSPSTSLWKKKHANQLDKFCHKCKLFSIFCLFIELFH